MIYSVVFPFILLSLILLINFIFNERNQYYYLSRYNIGKQFRIIVLKSVRSLILTIKNKLDVSIVESILRVISVFIFSIVGKIIWDQNSVSLDLGLSMLVFSFFSVTVLDNLLSKQSSIFQLKDHINSFSIMIVLIILNLEFPIQNRKIDIIISLAILLFCLYVTMLIFTSLRKINTRKKSVKIILEATVVLVLCELLYQKNILSLDLINPYVSLVLLFPYVLITNIYERMTSKKIINQNKNNNIFYFGVFLITIRFLIWKF